MRQTHGLFLVLLTSMLLGGCNKTATGPTPIERREKAIEEAVHDFKERLVALESQYATLAGVRDFPHSDLGFEFVNNAIEPRLYIAVPVEDTAAGGEPQVLPVGAEKIDRTSFITALQMECCDPDLRREIEKAYGLLRLDLKQIQE